MYGLFKSLPNRPRRDAGLGVLALLMIALLVCPTSGLAEPGPADGVKFQQRADEAVAVLQGRRRASATFNAHFLADVPAERLVALAQRLRATNGKILGAEDVRPDSASSATFRVRFARASATGHLTLDARAPFKIAGFRVTTVLPLGDTPQKIQADFAALPGRSGFAVVKLGDGAPVPLAARHADEQFAIGSTFKLWVLDALAEDVAAGRHHWNDVVPLGPPSLPGGITQDWPKDTPVTVQALATLMISLSDNTATDTLIRLVGRERIDEQVRATGHADPGRMLPIPTTAEVFALKLGSVARRDAYARADEAGRAHLLDAIDAPRELADADATPLDSAPVAIDRIEWFASPMDVARVLDSLRRRSDPRLLDILGIAANLDDRQREAFAFAGYKGGSESGVLALTWLLRDKAGAWFVVTASWNDPARELDSERLETLAPRLIELVRQGA